MSRLIQKILHFVTESMTETRPADSLSGWGRSDQLVVSAFGDGFPSPIKG